MGTHKATVTLKKDVIQRISKTRSTSLQRSVSVKISSGINVGIASIGSEIGASVAQKVCSSESIAKQITDSIATKGEVTLNSHAKECTEVKAPYGLVFTLTMKGTLTVKRNLNVNSNTRGVKWGAINLDYSKIKFNLSVDPQVFIDEIKVKSIPGCESGERVVEYKVKRGDTLSDLAVKYKTTIDEIKKLNRKIIKHEEVIFKGDILRIRTRRPEHKQK